MIVSEIVLWVTFVFKCVDYKISGFDEIWR